MPCSGLTFTRIAVITDCVLLFCITCKQQMSQIHLRLTLSGYLLKKEIIIPSAMTFYNLILWYHIKYTSLFQHGGHLNQFFNITNITAKCGNKTILLTLN